MSDPWEDEVVAGEDDWDEGRESLEIDVEDAFGDPEELEAESRDADDEGE